MPLACPRDATELSVAIENTVEVDRCGTCHGAWYEIDELSILEGTVADDDARRGMIDYAKRESDLTCPVCSARMRAFNYRAYNLELDACTNEHGFWLDAGEAQRVQDVMTERVAGLARSANAEADWVKFKQQGNSSGGIIGSIKRMFGGK
jgi:Zn-finger nucleic acid-binding protein